MSGSCHFHKTFIETEIVSDGVLPSKVDLVLVVEKLVLDPLGLVTTLLLLRLSSRRLSPEPILSNRALALENLS